MQTPLLWHLRLITVSVSTRLELGRSGKPFIPPSPMNAWLMPAGCHDSKIWFFPLMEMTDDNAPGPSWLPFRSLHVALIARLMESAWKWSLSIHLVSPERVSRTAELSFQGNEPPRDDSAIALRTIVKKCHICFFLTNRVLITTGDQTATWTSTAPNRTSRLALRITGNPGWEQRSTYLNHTHAGVQENGSFGLFGDLLIFVEVQVIRAVPELGQVEIPPLEGLKQRAEMGFAGKNKQSFFSPQQYINILGTKSFIFCFFQLQIVDRVSYPHGDADGTVHVAFTQPAMLGDATFLGSQGGCILEQTEKSDGALLERGKHLPIASISSEIITQFFWCLVRKRLGWFEAPEGFHLSAKDSFDAAVWDDAELNMRQGCLHSNIQKMIKQAMTKPNKYRCFSLRGQDKRSRTAIWLWCKTLMLCWEVTSHQKLWKCTN